MPRIAHMLALAAAAAGCTRGSDEVARPPSTRDARRGTQVSTNSQTPVDRVVLAKVAEIDDDTIPDQLAFAPDGKTWVSAYFNGVTVMQGDRRVARYEWHDMFGAPISFSSDGNTLHVGRGDADLTTGAVAAPSLVSQDLVAWATSKGYPAPPTLSITTLRKSDDGKLVVAAATGTTRDRRTGSNKAKTGNNEWLFALDGATSQPIAVMYTTAELGFDHIAISDRFVSACGFAGLFVFGRDALEKPIDLGAALRGANRVVWSADGGLLAAADTSKNLAIWRTGSWTAPAATVGLPENGGAIAFDPARPLLAVGGNDGHVRIYQVDDASLSAPIVAIADEAVGGPVQAVAWSPDGANLLVAAAVPQGKILRFAVTVTP